METKNCLPCLGALAHESGFFRECYGWTCSTKVTFLNFRQDPRILQVTYA